MKGKYKVEYTGAVLFDTKEEAEAMYKHLVDELEVGGEMVAFYERHNADDTTWWWEHKKTEKVGVKGERVRF